MTREQTTIPNIEYTTATGRYDESRLPINLIVLHSTAGTLQSAISLFESAPAVGKETSAHYIIANDGKLYQGLEEYFTAYHCGNYTKNQSSIGIEHVDEGANVKLHTDAQYAMSAKLVKDICTFYNIPIDSAHIVPHASITATACPNGLDVNRIIREAKGEVVDDCPAKLSAITAERDRLNGIIEKKDGEIDTLTKQNIALKSDLEAEKRHSEVTLTAELSKQREQLLTEGINERKALQQDFELQLAKAKEANPEKIVEKETPLSKRFEKAKWSVKRKAILDIILA